MRNLAVWLVKNVLGRSPSEPIGSVTDRDIMSLCKSIKSLEKFESFAMPLAMFAAMGCTVIFSKVLPDSIANFTWYEIGKAV